MSDLIAGLYTTPEMAALFSAEAHVEHMLAFEAALARAQVRAGVIPQAAAAAIAEGCRVERFDLAALYREAQAAGTPAIPLVRMLVELVPPEARRYVHWGATSQDAIDTALMLQTRAGLDLLRAGLLELCAGCAALAEQHRRTPMAGRTLLQQALPISFGLKAARWLALVARQVRALREQRERGLALQLGGAAGTLAALGGAGPHVAAYLAEELQLPLPDLPWHAERDRVATLAAALGITAGAVAKLAGDIVLLAQTEVAEVAEAAEPGRGGSSTLPQKRNPIAAVQALAAARLASSQLPALLASVAHEHERAAGGWQAEWIAIPDLFRYTAGAVARARDAVLGLQVDAQQMRGNLARGGGFLMAESLAMALAPQIGRSEAQRLVQSLCANAQASGLSLHQAAHADQQICALLSDEQIGQALDPAAYLGSSDVLIDRALETYRAVQAEET